MKTRKDFRGSLLLARQLGSASPRDQVLRGRSGVTKRFADIEVRGSGATILQTIEVLRKRSRVCNG